MLRKLNNDRINYLNKNKEEKEKEILDANLKEQNQMKLENKSNTSKVENKSNTSKVENKKGIDLGNMKDKIGENKEILSNENKEIVSNENKEIVNLEEKKCKTIQGVTLSIENLLQTLIDKSVSSIEILKSILNSNANILENQTEILNHLNEWADKGETYKVDGTATTTIANIDCVARFTHGVKTYILINDGANDIYIVHNLTGLALMMATDIDLTLKFHRVIPNETYQVIYNRNVINTISYITATGQSAFRLQLTW